MLPWKTQNNMTVITLMTSIDRSQKQEERRCSYADAGKEVAKQTAIGNKNKTTPTSHHRYQESEVWRKD